MTHSNSVSTGDRGTLSALRRILPRDELFALIAILACANGLVARVSQTVNDHGWADAAVAGAAGGADRGARLDAGACAAGSAAAGDAVVAMCG